ncbi:MAG: alanine dehydrogenase [Flavobacteriales bacterium]|nr:alanine dehydrogenase [Flavobacteriia bacterium]NCP05421.1 alanine dehydrogenase [Flavobacteriales bacterium]PIV94962.1 MAG: alanine dehydrogenase [Flavobacteriaceae bacterium CG17_big_fil_post_rev_8_21_14_2_50_33_15]PIY11424.1 MAG: alanine dehydrogenase [Flavobacteriaceae bacterium CG_4_10_14_3_um_filter_33_47]PJB19218.1 MAG: alanine dehydrogenase [Flavobacteriaceae bacterium CG_4_9_14_3_um_filter_33_16]
MKFTIIKERKTPADRRVVLTPSKLIQAQKQFPDAIFKIESSDIRVFSNKDYTKAGFKVTHNVSDCDVFIGVKEVPIENLIPNKAYFFFSHTIKKQPYNRKLLKAVLEKNIVLYDHETIVNEKGFRLIGFGRYAGIVGTYNGFRAWGLKYNVWNLPKAEAIHDQKALINQLQNLTFPNIKILLTGSGKVANGSQEILDAVPIKKVSVDDYLNQTFNEPVYCKIDVLDYNKRKDGKVIDMFDFFNNPQDYESNFMRFAKVTNYYIAGHFYGNGAPEFFTKEAVKSSDFKIKVIADISCDVNNGPIPTTLRTSTIEEPFYGYDPQTEAETGYKNESAIAVMSVDNLPCELPKDASEGFGNQFLQHVMPAFFNNDKDGVLARAKITENGQLTSRFAYLQDYVDGLE